MSGEIVNLRRARKDRRRTEQAAEAAVNRAQYGRTRAERDAAADQKARAVRHLDAHKLSASDDDAG